MGYPVLLAAQRPVVASRDLANQEKNIQYTHDLLHTFKHIKGQRPARCLLLLTYIVCRIEEKQFTSYNIRVDVSFFYVCVYELTFVVASENAYKNPECYQFRSTHVLSRSNA